MIFLTLDYKMHHLTIKSVLVKVSSPPARFNILSLFEHKDALTYQNH